MDRIVKRHFDENPKSRTEPHRRPLRSDAKRLTDGELLARLRSFGLDLDRASLEALCEQAVSAEEIAEPLLDRSIFRSKPANVESDWIWICLVELWRRWFPDKPSFEALDDRMQSGYELLASAGAVAACRVWLEAWTDVLRILDKTGIESIDEFDGRFRGTQSLFNWIQDLEGELWNAGLDDRKFLAARIALCEEALRRFPAEDEAGDLLTENRRRALAESWYELGETEKAEALYRDWLSADPRWGWGWVGWSDQYQFTRTERTDLARSEQLLREGLAVAEVRDREVLVERLADLCEQQGREEEARRLREQASLVKKGRSHARTGGKSLRRKTEIVGPDMELPSETLSKLAAGRAASSPPPAAARRKVGRNEPCLCGSGKKYKKCCGA